MTRQSTPASNNPTRSDSKSAARIPDKPRDCGPHVDTWPILDTQDGESPSNNRSVKPGKQSPER
jgi:hypothetical protein